MTAFCSLSSAFPPGIPFEYATAKAQDRVAISQILGPESRQLISGDPVRDALALDVFSKLVAEKSVVDKSGEDKAVFVLGELGWPFPIPVLEKGGRWTFDTASKE